MCISFFLSFVKFLYSVLITSLELTLQLAFICHSVHIFVCISRRVYEYLCSVVEKLEVNVIPFCVNSFVCNFAFFFYLSHRVHDPEKRVTVTYIQAWFLSLFNSSVCNRKILDWFFFFLSLLYFMLYTQVYYRCFCVYACSKEIVSFLHLPLHIYVRSIYTDWRSRYVVCLFFSLGCWNFSVCLSVCFVNCISLSYRWFL